MNGTDFYRTRMGQRFYEHTVPELVRQLQRLNANLERLVEAAERKTRIDPEGGTPRGQEGNEETHP